MNQKQPEPKTVFATPWFSVLAAPGKNETQPHYMIRSPDFVVIVALDEQRRLLLVRQFRPPVGGMTLELPAGHVEAGETPEQAARKELLEETGYQAEHFKLLASFSPSAARFTNRMWCFFAADAKLAPHAGTHREQGVDLVLYERSVRHLIDEKEFYNSPSCTALFAAITRSVLALD